MTLDFDYQPLPWNIVFGAGALTRLPDELRKLGLSRALVLCAPPQSEDAQRVVELLGPASVGLFDRSAQDVPVSTVAEALAAAVRLNAGCTVAVGGRSTIGLGKALALKLSLDNVAIPTSYAGAEMTDFWSIAEDGGQVSGRDHRVVPNLTLYDPVLTLNVSPRLSAASGLNAMGRAAISVTATGNPFVAAMAREAVRRLSCSLPRVLEAPDDLEARSEALSGASLAGGAVDGGSAGLHHRLCRVVESTANTPHAETQAVLLPYSIAYNADAAETRTAALAAALTTDDAALGMHTLVRRLGAPTGLRELGVQEADLERVADRILEVPPDDNPAPITREGIRGLLDDAYFGRAP